MTRVATPWVGRRAALIGLTATGLMLRPGQVLAGAAGAGPVLTPPQTEGPFYPVDWSGDADNDLVVFKGDAATAMGTITHITGRVTSMAGEPVSGAVVEIWQCDANGIYRHPADNSWRRRSDGHFQSRGRSVTDANGVYSFRTIKPVPYPGRTPHIHFKVLPRAGEPLTTQMYVFGEPQNDRDFILQSLEARQRESVIVKLDAADRIETGALAGVFDIVLA